MDIDDPLRRAISLHRAGDPAAKEALYTQVLAARPDMAEIRLNYAPEPAVDSLRAALRTRPGRPNVTLPSGRREHAAEPALH